jgi:glutamyl/glutaminyl-tRNA synthetase
VLHFDPVAAINATENQEILAAESSRTVLMAVAAKLEAEDAPLEAARFKAILKEVQKETGIKGAALFHPVRIALTGQQSGPEFDRLVPLMEEGSQLTLPKAVPAVHERLKAFLAAQQAH